MDHCKPPCWDRCKHEGDRGWQEGGQGQWQPIDPPRGSCGSCWAFGQNAASDVQKDAAAEDGQAAAYDYGRDDLRDYRPYVQQEYWQEAGMNAQQNMPGQQEYAADWAGSQSSAWPYYQNGAWNG